MSNDFVKTNVSAAITLDHAKLNDEIARKAQEAAKSAVSNIIDYNFRKKGYFNEPPGAAYLLCVDAVESYILSEEFQGVMARLIRQHVEQATSEAILTILKSKTRKQLFTIGD